MITLNHSNLLGVRREPRNSLYREFIPLFPTNHQKVQLAKGSRRAAPNMSWSFGICRRGSACRFLIGSLPFSWGDLLGVFGGSYVGSRVFGLFFGLEHIETLLSAQVVFFMLDDHCNSFKFKVLSRTLLVPLIRRIWSPIVGI